ncbi:MBL fold metallo-hydrolase [bacterium]|nr:MBL fold metallo-hydrolase [bacterium]
MIFTSLGASEEIGASCHYILIDGTGILLDAGADPEKEGIESVPDLQRILSNPDWPVDHVIVSHAHHDHLGSLPVVVKMFPHARVHMSAATRSLSDILLPASARLQRRKVEEGSTEVAPLFAEEDVEACSYLYQSHELETDFDLSGLKARFEVSGELYDAGHVLGSVGVHITWVENGKERTLFFSGDTGLRNQTIIPGASYPDDPVDVLLLESTLGADPDAELFTRKAEEKRLGKAMSKVLKRGGVVLMPVFALGRAQEMLALVERFKTRGLIDDSVPVYTAGMMRAISDAYDKSRQTTPRLNEEFEVFGVKQRRLPRTQGGLNEALKQPCILAVGSGMMFERTISNKIAQMLVENEKHGVFLVGYARDDSPAALLAEARAAGKGTMVTINKAHGPQAANCDVERFRFSGHSHRRDLLSMVDMLQPEKIVLVHGEKAAKQWMVDNIKFFYPEIEVMMPATNDVLEV